jgi:hypothetical protein
MANGLDLSSLFGLVTERLSEKKENLNEADSYNHNHGDNMVQIFSLIQNAVTDKKDEPVAQQLKFASQQVDEKVESGSAKLYAEGLASAAEKFTDSQLDPSNIGDLVKSLLGADKPEKQEKPKQNSGFLGSILGGLLGQSKSSDDDEGLGLDELLRAGMAFYQSKQDGADTSKALISALLAASPMGQSEHRSQSGSIVASTILDFAKSFMN